MKKCLIIEPHSDDSCISSAGFLRKYESKFEYYFQMMIASDIKLHHSNRTIGRIERINEYVNYVSTFKHSNLIGVNDILDFDTKMDQFPMAKLVGLVEKSISKIKPDLLIIQGDSYHQDHHAVYKACLAALRPCCGFYPKEIWIAENPTYVHEDPVKVNPKPDIYVELTEKEIDEKIKLYNSAFPSQIRPNTTYLSNEGLKYWASYRGIEARCKYAEAFYLFAKRI